MGYSKEQFQDMRQREQDAKSVALENFSINLKPLKPVKNGKPGKRSK